MKIFTFNRSEEDEDSGGDPSVAGAPDASDMKTRATLYLAIVYVVICVVGLAANAAVLYMIARSRRSKAVTNIYIFNLAVADLLYALCLPAAVYQMLNGQWTFGHIMCKFYYTCDGVSKFASVMFLVILSFDRYVAVCHPIRCRAVRTAKLAFVTTGTAWALVILAMVPVYMHATLLQVTETDSDTFQCVIYWPPPHTPTLYDLNGTGDDQSESSNGSFLNGTNPWIRIRHVNESGSFFEEANGPVPGTSWNRRIFTLYLFTLSFLTPLAMVWIFYTMILHRLWAQKRRLFSSNTSLRENATTTKGADDDDRIADDDEHRTSLRQKKPMLPSQIPAPAVNAANQRRTRSTKRVTIMVLSIVICYTVCWIPYWSLQLTIEFFPDAVQAIFTIDVFTIFSYIAYGMQSVNSMLNPFLYAFGTQTHRRRFWVRYRRFLGVVGCRWRFFGIGAQPPRDSLLRTYTTDRSRSHIAEEESGLDSCVLRRQDMAAAKYEDRLRPPLASNSRRPVTASLSYCGSEVSHAFTSCKTTTEDDQFNQSAFAYCLCCYCEPADAAVEPQTKPMAKKNPTGRTVSANKEALSRDYQDDDEEE